MENEKPVILHRHEFEFIPPQPPSRFKGFEGEIRLVWDRLREWGWKKLLKSHVAGLHRAGCGVRGHLGLLREWHMLMVPTPPKGGLNQHMVQLFLIIFADN